MSLIAYAITLWKQPDLLDQRQGPAIPYVIFAALFTVMDWFHAVEQGERCEFELGPNQQTEAMLAQQQPTAAGVAEPTVLGVPNSGMGSAAEESQAQDYRVDIRSPRHVKTVAVSKALGGSCCLCQVSVCEVASSGELPLYILSRLQYISAKLQCVISSCVLLVRDGGTFVTYLLIDNH